MLNAISERRLESAIKFMESGAFKHVGEETNDDVITILVILYDYRRELRDPQRRRRLVSQ